MWAWAVWVSCDSSTENGVAMMLLPDGPRLTPPLRKSLLLLQR